MSHILTIGCNCVGCCTIARFERFSPSEWNETDDTYVEFYQSVREHPRWRYRVRAAWDILRNRRDWSECLVLGPRELHQLHDWLEEQMGPNPPRLTVTREEESC